MLSSAPVILIRACKSVPHFGLCEGAGELGAVVLGGAGTRHSIYSHHPSFVSISVHRPLPFDTYTLPLGRDVVLSISPDFLPVKA